ncbi:uncharacterized protein PV09_01126 [Verruconis gallopava]|uniref:RraA-like protein n=1 Tax=Verruconis gallopava TaxID=253628 RepID=A0A0D1XZF3_9PEZI|nr:uncharacterized protein PV09_01126 [Verruconis gallopava]KIW08196.1 hypothetical protein PV09_01126 [Verruconis gallopava]
MASIAKESVLAALRKFTTCDIGDALFRLKVPHGGYLSGLRMFSAPNRSRTSKILGPAYMVKMVLASDTTSPTPNQHFADTIPAGSVVFVSQPSGLISACWGGLMSTRATARGAEGVVIDGRFRDIHEHQALGIGLFARDGSILGSNTFTRASELNVPLSYKIKELPNEEIGIRPNDLIMGDADGVVVIPSEFAEKCVELCQLRWEIDEKTRECLNNGDDMGATIKRLRK